MDTSTKTGPEKSRSDPVQRDLLARTRDPLRGLLGKGGRWNSAIVLLSLFVMAAIWALAIERIGHERQNAIDDAVRNNTNLALALEEHTVRTIKSVDQTLAFIEGKYLDEGDKAGMREFIKQSPMDDALILNVGVLDERGLLVLSRAKSEKTIDASDREYFRVHQEKDRRGMFIGKPLVGLLTGEATIHMSRAITRPDGSFGGVAFASVATHYFSAFYQQADLGKDGVIMLVGLDGITRARRAGVTSTFGQDMTRSALFASYAKAPKASYVSAGTLDGIPRFISYRTLPEYPLIVAVGKAQTEVLAEYWQRQRYYILGATLATLFTAIFAGGIVAAQSRQRRAMAALASRDARLSATFNQAAVGIAQTGLDGRFLQVNRRLCDMLGYTEQELLQLTFSDVTHPDDRDVSQELQSRLLAATADDPSPVIEKRYLHKSGATVWALLAVAVVVGDDGNPDYFVSVMQDITPRKRAEAALRDSQEMLQTAVASGNVGLWDWDFATGKVFYSREWKSQLGYDDHEIGDSLREWERLINPDDSERAHAMIDTCLKEPATEYRVEFRMKHKNGTWRWILAQGSVHCDAQGAPRRLVGCHVDITERKRAEAALEEDSVRRHMLFDQSPDGIVILDPETARPVEFNEAAYRQLGYTREEFAGLSVSDVDAMETPEQTRTTIASVMQRGRADFDTRHRTKEGEIRDVHVTAQIIDVQDRSVYYCVWRDVTEQKRTEARLHALNLLYLTLSGTNEAIIRSVSRRELCERICRLVSETGGWAGAWIGFVDESTRRIVPEAWSDSMAPYIAGVLVSIDPSLPEGNGPTSIAARTGKPYFCNDVYTDPATVPWLNFVKKFGMGSAAAVPLRLGDAFVGVINLYAAQKDFYTPEVQALLADLAADVSFALHTLDRDEQRRIAQEQLRLSAKAFESIADGVIVTDARQRIVSVNPAFSAITGYPAEEILGQTPGFLRSGRHDAAFYAAIWHEIDREGHWRGEIWDRRRNGEIYPELLSISAVKDASGTIMHYVGVFTDISSLKQYEARLQHQAHHDALTGLPNRFLFHERFHEAIRRAQRYVHNVGVMFLDLDRFKNVNDSLGHAVGDQLLEAVGKRLTASVRETDTVARFGGDEFAVLLDTITDNQAAASVAQKLLDALSHPYQLGGHELYLSASIGISCCPHDGTDPETLFKNADTAMYRAKAEGRNNYQFFAAEMNARALESLVMSNQLRLALERNEFLLHYQPLIDLRTRRISGVEALVRWQHPERGMIPPGEFIPLAEEIGLIESLGEWVLRTGCRQMREWLDAGLPMARVAVNLSARQFRHPDLVQLVAGILQDTRLPAHHLELEVTESMVMQNPEGAADVLSRLKAMGVTIAVDDFGTGYSSLSYLKRFPIDFLKIDKSFVDGVPQDADDAAIVRAIVALAKSLNLRLIAEGVETAEQRQFLENLGCDEGQGYLFSKPVPPIEIGRLIGTPVQPAGPMAVAAASIDAGPA